MASPRALARPGPPAHGGAEHETERSPDRDPDTDLVGRRPDRGPDPGADREPGANPEPAGRARWLRAFRAAILVTRLTHRARPVPLPREPTGDSPLIRGSP